MPEEAIKKPLIEFNENHRNAHHEGGAEGKDDDEEDKDQGQTGCVQQ